MIKGSIMLHLGPIWYHSEPSDVPYFQNLPRPISWFGLFLQQNDSRCNYVSYTSQNTFFLHDILTHIFHYSCSQILPKHIEIIWSMVRILHEIGRFSRLERILETGTCKFHSCINTQFPLLLFIGFAEAFGTLYNPLFLNILRLHFNDSMVFHKFTDSQVH